MKLHKAFKFRIYPDDEQKGALAIQFGHARFVYNHYRRVREEYYYETATGLSYRDTTDDLAQRLKVEYPWLSEAHSQVLQQTLKDLDRAYVNFFAGRAAYPRFKKKHAKQSIRFPQGFKLDGQRIYLPKVGWVRIVRHRRIEGVMKNCTVSRTKTGKYFVAIQCEMDVDEPTPAESSVGIDLGLTTFVTLSTGEKVKPPQHLRRTERRLKIRQRRLSRKQKGSNSRAKQRQRVAATHERVTNQRRDFHHKLSRQIVDRFGIIGFETLNVRGMLANHHLAKSISDAGWYQFVTFTSYKAAWAGGTVEKADQWYPSSKLCSACGEKNASLKLSDRQWVCLGCGAIHDRDENAAKNLEPLPREPREVTPVEIRAAVAHSAPENSQGTALEAQAL